MNGQLDPEIAEAIKLVPFDDLTTELLPRLRVRFGIPGSDRVERTDRECCCNCRFAACSLAKK